MVLLGQDTFPLGARGQLGHLVSHVSGATLHAFRIRQVYDVLHLFLGDATVVVELGLVLERFKSVHVQVEVQVSGDH